MKLTISIEKFRGIEPTGCSARMIHGVDGCIALEMTSVRYIDFRHDRIHSILFTTS
jgi:hypothetical protein